MNMFWALILTAHFNPHLRAKMSPSKVQNIFIPLEHKLYCFIMIFMCCYSPCSVDGEGVSVFIQHLNGGFNPLHPNSDQNQFSPNNIHTLSRDTVMRINQMITNLTENQCFDLFLNSLNLSRRKCMNISLENLCVDIGAQYV